MNRRLISLVAACLLPFTCFAQQLIPKFEKGEKVALIGDSITHGGHYHSYIWLYYMTRFPNMPIWLYNCGVGGETSSDMLLRLDADVFTKKPSYVTLTFGMNDTGYADVFNKENTSELSQQRIDKSIDSFGKIIDAISTKLPLSKVVMIGGSPYDETSRFDTNILKGKNTAIQTIIKEQQRVAEEREWGFVDFNQPMCDISAKLQTESPEYSFSPQDRIHPDKDGQMVMAFLFLEAQGLAGVKVSDIEVDAQSEKAILSENCKISSIRRTNDGVAFSYLAVNNNVKVYQENI